MNHNDSDQTRTLQQQVRQAAAAGDALSIHGSGSHQALLGDFAEAERLELARHSGILDYQPTELTIKARAGTPLATLREALAEGRQRLATDFPELAETATLGGALAIGQTGPARPFRGAIRDAVLGVTLLGADGEVLHFGGQVMKNVAGYDVSRLLCGSRGTLGVMLDITLKVMPLPELSVTLSFEAGEDQAIHDMNHLAGKPLPLSAAIFVDGHMLLRLEGSAAGVEAAAEELLRERDGTRLEPAEAETLWRGLNRHEHPFFAGDSPLWRVVVPPTTPKLELECAHRSLTDWAGGLRWLRADRLGEADFAQVRRAGGYVESFRGSRIITPAELMSPLQRKLHRQVKKAFDPGNLFNPKLSNFGNP
jgi:glycolate oxidase FAD binding subunit